MAATIAVGIASAAIAQPSTRPTTAALPEPTFPQKINDAASKASKFLGKTLDGGHAEATDKPPPAGGGGAAPPWGLATACAGEAAMHAGWGDPVAVAARKWLTTAPVAAEAAPATIHAVGIWENERELRGRRLTDELVEAIARFASGKGPPTDQELSHIAQSTIAVLWMTEPRRQQYRAVPAPLWDALVKRILAAQQPNGSWGTPQTTAQCIDMLHQLMRHERSAVDRRVADQVPAAINRAFATLSDVPLTTASFATLDAIAVAAKDVGLQYVGQQDWYRVGAMSILLRQNADGSFGTATNAQRRIIDTSLALRFLLRGRDCLTFGRFESEFSSRRPALQQLVEMSNLSESTGRDLCRYATWERVSVRTSLDDLSDLPVVVIAGNGKLQFSDAEVQLLRQYTERGGVLLCIADRSNPVTVASYEKLASLAFPGTTLRELPPDHPLLDITLSPLATPKAWLRTLPTNARVLGVSNGVREMMIVVERADPAGAWSRNDKRRDDWAFDLGSDALIYGCVERLVHGDETRAGRYDRTPASKLPNRARTVQVTTYSPTLASFPEPYAWTRMAQVLQADGIVLTASPGDLSALDARRQKLLHICGTGSFKLTPAERDAIAAFTKAGGTVLIEAAKGDPQFLQSAKAELLPPLGFAADVELVEFGIANVNVQPTGANKLRFRTTVPQPAKPVLCSLTLDGRPAVIFCSANLSLGMADIGTADVVGLTTASSTQIARHLVLSLR